MSIFELQAFEDLESNLMFRRMLHCCSAVKIQKQKFSRLSTSMEMSTYD